MHQHFGARMPLHQTLQRRGFELLVHHARALPAQHVGAGFALHIIAEVFVRRPQNFLAARVQMRDDFERDGRGDHPVGARLDRGAGVGVDHHRALRMRVAKRGESVGRTSQIQRAFGRGFDHQNALVRAQDFRRLAHEPHPRDDDRVGRMTVAESRHFQRIGHAAAAGVSQVLQRAVDIIMRHQHRVLRFQFARERRRQRRGLRAVQLRMRRRPRRVRQRRNARAMGLREMRFGFHDGRRRCGR